MVPDDKLANAVSLNSASFNLGRLIGPGLAGVVIALWGVGPALLLNTVTFVFVIVALLRLRTERAAPGAPGRGAAAASARGSTTCGSGATSSSSCSSSSCSAPSG